MPSKPQSAGSAIALPALRGNFGDWTYYSAVVPLPELAARVAFANEIHTNVELSKLIQRSLKGDRATDIAEYLSTQPERFFNSLVIALYGGAPEWVPLDIRGVTPGGANLGLRAESLGVLNLSGAEKLFAVDGQHRLAGMKRFVEDQDERPDELEQPTAESDLVSVLFIAHRTDRIERTRRLFTTLNKTAIPVSKMERIALDENDVSAIIARRLVEENEWFSVPRIAMRHTNNLGKEEGVALTTIGNLYDILKSLFLDSSGLKKKDLEYDRPSDGQLDVYYKQATKHFEAFASVEPALRDYFKATNPREVCQLHRTDTGGSVYFRPMGLAIMTEVAIRLKKEKGPDGIQWMKALPRRLDQAPFDGTIWSHRNTIDPKHRVLCRDLLLHMCDVPVGSSADLKAKYSEVLGSTSQLPRKVQPKL
ncbi:MAG: DGQHR domain-containing protein [Roseateles sp.]|uniref:DGQHR domain-containing protein n=1 Tax=Roseateles sp. TaxID=1971397 RepID=UPI0040372B6A